MIVRREFLKKGGFGQVFLMNFAYRTFVTKRIICKDQEQQEWAETQARIHGSCNHPNIVQCIGYFPTLQGNGILAMEYLNGGTLRDLQQYTQQDIYNYVSQICLGLRYLHGRQIIHRDLKPDNILLNRDTGIVKIADFGLSKRVMNADQLCTSQQGTVSHVAPEILLQREYGPEVDMWALGVIIYELSHQFNLPFEDPEDDDDKSKDNVVKVKYRVDANAPVAIKKLLRMLLVKDQKRRARAEDILALPFIKAAMREFMKKQQNM